MRLTSLSIILCLGLALSSCTINPTVAVKQTAPTVNSQGQVIAATTSTIVSGGASFLTDVEEERAKIVHGTTVIEFERKKKNETAVAKSVSRGFFSWKSLQAFTAGVMRSSDNAASVDIAKSNNATKEVLGAQEVEKFKIGTEAAAAAGQ